MSASSPTDPENPKGGVTIGDVDGGIHDSVIIGGNLTIIQRITNWFSGGSEQQRALRNRRAMLQLVRNTWVKGVLEQSLHGAAMIELGMEERADAVERPWDMQVQMPGQPNRQLPHGTRIIEVFDEMSQSLLILGEPGSGKTTMLLELARDSIDRAEQDPTLPIPVVFNLSSWAEKKQRIDDWLVDELRSKYYVGKKDARSWVENNELLLLLDGLDEVRSELRNDCVKALNAFRQHSTQMVVCSRIADYEALTTRLGLCGAVLLQPLTAEQIDQYLAGTGAELLAVRTALESDPILGELAQTPVMLSMMTLAYRGLSQEDVGATGSVEATRCHLFATYVQRMFQRRRAEQPYTPERTIHWLAWLARKMSEHSQTTFFIEELQPYWLSARPRQRVLITSGHIAGLVAGFVAGVPAGFIDSARTRSDLEWFIGFAVALLTGLFSGLLLGLFFGLIGGMIGWLIGRLNLAKPVQTFNWSRTRALKGLFVGLLIGLLVGLATRVCCGLLPALFAMLFAVLFGVQVSGLDSVKPVETLKWSWRGVRRGFILGLVFALILGQVLASVFMLHLASEYGNDYGLVDILVAGLQYGLVLGLVIGPVFGLIGGPTPSRVESKSIPNQGIQQSARNALALALLGGASSGLVFWLGLGLFLALSSGIAAGLRDALLPALFIALAGAQVGGLILGGGWAVILHISLRYVLWRKGYIPWRCARFLDYATERIFLRKVGGGYIFVHRLLMEYFASLDNTTVSELAKPT